jgi:signal transduction histidine kinase
VRERLFKPFDTTKGASGMGIGAYQVREYLRGLGGRVEVDSAPGRGTRLRLVIPSPVTTEGHA